MHAVSNRLPRGLSCRSWGSWSLVTAGEGVDMGAGGVQSPQLEWERRRHTTADWGWWLWGSQKLRQGPPHANCTGEPAQPQVQAPQPARPDERVQVFLRSPLFMELALFFFPRISSSFSFPRALVFSKPSSTAPQYPHRALRLARPFPICLLDPPLPSYKLPSLKHLPAKTSPTILYARQPHLPDTGQNVSFRE